MGGKIRHTMGYGVEHPTVSWTNEMGGKIRHTMGHDVGHPTVSWTDEMGGKILTRQATTWDIQHFLVTGHAALRGDRLYGNLSRLVVVSAVWVLLGPTQPATSVPRPQLNPVPAAF